MRIEYFQLIDRIVDLNLADRKISSEALVPTSSTIFEGHFPGYPLMPGVLLIEAMAQTSGWLVVALNRFQRMPFLAAVKEAKLRTFVKPGELLSIDAHLEHDGSGYAIVEAKIKAESKLICDATLTLRAMLAGGYLDEALQWRGWLLRAIAGDPADLQIMYGIAGERRLDERELDWLPGFDGSLPVRVGNAASTQLQLDVYGER